MSPRSIALDRKSAGNAAYASGDYDRAADAYTAGLAARSDDASLDAVLHCNRAAAFAGAGRHLDAAADCFAALELDPGYAKARARRADALASLGAWGLAAADLDALTRAGVPGAATRAGEARAAAALAPAGAAADPYAVLALPRTATATDARASFRRLALRLHPDKATGPGGAAASAALFGLAADAASLLTDPAARRAHDARVRATAARARAAAARSGVGGVR